MIQRIQSLYLLVVAVMMATMFFTEVAFLTQGGESLRLGRDGIPLMSGEGEMTTSLLRIYALVELALVVLDVFLFRRRRLQMRLTVFCLLLSVGYYVLAGIYLYAGVGLGYEIEWSLPITFPMVSAILLWLAFRAILKDELLVKSIDRVR